MLLLLAAPAHAVITGVTFTDLSGAAVTTGDPEAWDWYSLTNFNEDCGTSCSAFTSRFQAGAGVESDGDRFIFGDGDITLTQTWQYQIDIQVQATGNWELQVDSGLDGYLTIQDETATGDAAAGVSALTGALTTPGLGLVGSLDLPGFDGVASASDANVRIGPRLDSFRVTGGFGNQVVTMTFSITGDLESNCSGGGCAEGGDEAAIRLGVPTAGFPDIIGFSAGNYPGSDGDPAAVHGHFLDFVLVAVPEPGILALLLGAFPALLLQLRRRAGRGIVPLIACVAFLAGTHPAGAAIITSVTGNPTVSVTPQGGPEPADYYAEAAFFDDCGASCSAFTGRLGANAGVEADAGENLRIRVEWSYTIDIFVDAAPMEAWELAVDATLAGYLTAVNQGSGRAGMRVTDLTGTLDTTSTPNLSLAGSMDLLGTDFVNTASGANQAVSRAGTFSVTGGFGPQTVSMTFTLDGRLRSQCSGGGCTFKGDEAAIRLGLPPTSTPPNFTAGDYPGPDGLPDTAHGHFLSFALVAVPEPSSLALLLGALPALIALRGCRR
jgi:hypothetical protein